MNDGSSFQKFINTSINNNSVNKLLNQNKTNDRFMRRITVNCNKPSGNSLKNLFEKTKIFSSKNLVNSNLSNKLSLSYNSNKKGGSSISNDILKKNKFSSTYLNNFSIQKPFLLDKNTCFNAKKSKIFYKFQKSLQVNYYNNKFANDEGSDNDNPNKLLNIINETKNSNENSSKNNEEIANLSKGIYWDKKTTQKMWSYLKEIVRKVKGKKDKIYHEILNYFENNQDNKGLDILLNENFIKFYRNNDEVFPEDIFFKQLVELEKFDIIQKMNKNKAYKFDSNYIFDVISEILQCYIEGNKALPHGENHGSKNINILKNLNNNSSDEVDKNNNSKNIDKNYKILTNLVFNNLYDHSERKVKLIAWSLSILKEFDAFKSLIADNEFLFQDVNEQYNNFVEKEDILNFGIDLDKFENAIESCLYTNNENLAINICEFHSHPKESGKISNIGAETESMKFLKYLWEKDYPFAYKNTKSIALKKSKNFFEKLKENDNDFNPNFSINSVIKILKQNYKKDKDVKKLNYNLNLILGWKNIDKDSTFIDSLFENKCFEQIGTLICKWPFKYFNNMEYFKTIIYHKQLELILFYLKKIECRGVLLEREIQEYILHEYLTHGHMLYYGSEMLMYIYKTQWKGDLTKALCRNITKILKTNDILNCHSPILTSLLLIEFLQQIKAVSILHANRCEELIKNLKLFCKDIQESSPRENYISFLMKQKDTKGRSCFDIVSYYSIFDLLKTPEIGLIVKKMWNGTLSNNGFFSASSMHRFMCDSNPIPSDPFTSFSKLDDKRVYYFQLCVWLDSCAIRSDPVGIATFILIVIYNSYIYLLHVKGQIFNNSDNVSSSAKMLYNIYLIFATCILFNLLNQIYICLKTKRVFKLTAFRFIDILLFIFAYLIKVDFLKMMGMYNQNQSIGEMYKNLFSSFHVPFLKAVNNESKKYFIHIAIILKISVLAINNILVWVRISGVLLTYKTMGPVITMIVSMGELLIKNIVIIAIFLACCAGIFTSLFNRFSGQFIDFSTSVVNLFGGFLNTFNCEDFVQEYKDFGNVLVMGYVCISSVLFVNLLIAVLSNVFEEMSKEVDATYRAIIIKQHRRIKWHKEYGYLLFLTYPFNVINIPFAILNKLLSINQEKYNKFVTRFYYILFYFPIIVLCFSIYTIFVIPFSYFKGLVIMIRFQSNLRILKPIKFLYVLKWMFGGFFFLLYIYFRDIFLLFYYVFNEVDEKTDEYGRVRKNITNDDVKIFLKFIHSPIKAKDRKDIHNLFGAYLEFEKNEKEKLNDSAKKKMKYYKKLKGSKLSESTVKINSISYNSTVLYSNFEASEPINSKLIRKNLMVIEILEHYLVEDDEENSYIDIEKMKKLLPLSMDIKNQHLRRLVFTDVNALIKVMTKLKDSKTAFNQYLIINKITSTAQRLDREIDREIFNIQIKKKGIRDTDINMYKKLKAQNENSQMNEIFKRKKELKKLKNFYKIIRQIDNDIIEIIENKRRYEEKIKNNIIYGENNENNNEIKNDIKNENINENNNKNNNNDNDNNKINNENNNDNNNISNKKNNNDNKNDDNFNNNNN